MNLFDVTLQAGIENQITMTGRYFRILEGVERINLKASNGEQSDIIQGVGVDVGQFDWLRLKSENTQVVTVLISDLPTTDSRLSGKLRTVDAGGTTVAGLAPITLAAPGAAVVAGNLNRILLEIQCDAGNGSAVWLGSSTTGLGQKMAAGDAWAGNISGDLDLYFDGPGTVYVSEVSQ
jgi:hypothetical protein